MDTPTRTPPQGYLELDGHTMAHTSRCATRCYARCSCSTGAMSWELRIFEYARLRCTVSRGCCPVFFCLGVAVCAFAFCVCWLLAASANWRNRSSRPQQTCAPAVVCGVVGPSTGRVVGEKGGREAGGLIKVKGAAVAIPGAIERL